MALSPGILIVAQKLQEAAMAMCHEDIRTRIADALGDAYEGTGNWAYVVAVFGDDSSGDCVYSVNGDLKKAPYVITGANCKIDVLAAVDVAPLTTYEVESVESREAGARNSKRDLMQLQTIHDSAAALGANCSMQESTSGPKDRNRGTSGNPSGGGTSASGRSGSASGREAQVSIPSGDSTMLKLVESWDWKEQALALVESGASSLMKIKLIAPGAGSSAFYPAEVLKRDGPKVFTEGTHIYINHATAAEEAHRPEGDWHKLAGALKGNAYWDESAKQGPGLYGDALFTSDYAPLIKEKAPFTGMSIRASGVAESGKKQNGLPVLKELTSAESVDVVTRAGAGGMILTESAKAANPQEVDMTKEEVQALVESATKAAVTQAVTEALAKVAAPVATLEARALRGDAMVEANKILAPLTLHEAVKAEVLKNVLRDIPAKEGKLDSEAFTALVTAESKRLGTLSAQLTGSGRVNGMGQGTPVVLDEAEVKRQETARAAEDLDAESVFKRFGLNESAAKAAARRVA